MAQRTLQMDWGFDGHNVVADPLRASVDSDPLKASVQSSQTRTDGQEEADLSVLYPEGAHGARRESVPQEGGTGINFAVGTQRGLKIQSIVPGGPASRATPHPDDTHLFPPNATGAEVLRHGDVLFKVNGRDVLDLNVSAVAPLLRGPMGSTVEITVLRQQEGEDGGGGVGVPVLLRSTVVRGLLPQGTLGGGGEAGSPLRKAAGDPSEQLANAMVRRAGMPQTTAIVSSHKPRAVILASQACQKSPSGMPKEPIRHAKRAHQASQKSPSGMPKEP